MYSTEKSNFDHIVERQRMLREKRAAQEQKCSQCVYKTEIAPGHIYCPFWQCVMMDKANMGGEHHGSKERSRQSDAV